MKPEEISDLISKAFTPYTCEVALSELNHFINFRILNKDDTLICTFNDLDITNMTMQEVKDIIETSKTEIRNRDFVID